jgi:hypothetical protein
MKSKLDLKKHIDNLVEILNSINVNNSVTILTGSNGSGKSLIRKQMLFRVARALEKDPKNGPLVASTSMEMRTGSNPEFGALSGAGRDNDVSPTSQCTLENIEALLVGKHGENRYIVIDEPEIGMGEEMVVALVNWLNEECSSLKKKKIYGVLVITHNRYIVENLKHEQFLNIDGYKTKEEWLERKIVPTDLKEFNKKSMDLFLAIRDRSK